MKSRIIGAVRTVVFVLAGIALGIGIMIGAILQESYKLCPVTEAELAAEVQR